MHQFIDEIDDQPYMRGDFVLNKLIQACKYLYREDFERMSSEQRTATKDNVAAFTPERLLGVLTNRGFVEGIASVDSNIYLITGSHIISASRCKFYISDDSDETASFEDYVNKFYDGGIGEAKFTR